MKTEIKAAKDRERGSIAATAAVWRWRPRRSSFVVKYLLNCVGELVYTTLYTYVHYNSLSWPAKLDTRKRTERGLEMKKEKHQREMCGIIVNFRVFRDHSWRGAAASCIEQGTYIETYEYISSTDAWVWLIRWRLTYVHLTRVPSPCFLRLRILGHMRTSVVVFPGTIRKNEDYSWKLFQF